MTNTILSALGVEDSSFFYHNTVNLYHNGDKIPFGNLYLKNGKISLKVNSGEAATPASSCYLGKYVKP